MKFITDLKEANDLLHLYAGATVKIAMFSESLGRLALRITLSGREKVLYLLGVSCARINGPFRFENAVLLISKETGDDILIRIYDETSGFELITSGGFSMVEGIESEFGSSFDNFIKEDHY